MNAIFDNFTESELKNFEAKKRGFISFEAADSFEAKKAMTEKTKFKKGLKK